MANQPTDAVHSAMLNTTSPSLPTTEQAAAPHHAISSVPQATAAPQPSVVLRDYQQHAVRAVVHYFRRQSEPAVLVLPTGAGKSLVIAELARLARGQVLVLTHVKELVEQNYLKYCSYGLDASIFAAGLGRKENQHQVVFASIQSISRNLAEFANTFSLLVIDECHRVPEDTDSSYQKTIAHLKSVNPNLKILGLTATPYRLGTGFIYQYHAKGQVKTDEPRFFRFCIYELALKTLIDRGYLTPPQLLDAPVLSYDFSGLTPTLQGFRPDELAQVIDRQKKITPQIVAQILHYSQQRHGVMIFAASTSHARHILSLLPAQQSALVLADTPAAERRQIIENFKQQQLKYLVNVSVLTTGFDAPHVDLIAILRPTESVSLYQQMIGRGLRLSPGKTSCLVLDYAGNLYDLHQPDIQEHAPDPAVKPVIVPCPLCQFQNEFWGKADPNGFVMEHFGRRCQGFRLNENGQVQRCDFRFKAKYCLECGTEHDIAARQCRQCGVDLVDPEKKLKEALGLKDALIFAPHQMLFSRHQTDKGTSLKVSYIGAEGEQIHEFWPLKTPAQKKAFATKFVPSHLNDRFAPFTASTIDAVIAQQHRLQAPAIVIARKEGRFWRLRDKLFAQSFATPITQLPQLWQPSSTANL